MKWQDLLEQLLDTPLFHSSMLQIFGEPKSHLQVQLSRWVETKKLTKIRRSWYLISKPYRSKEIPPEVIANRVVSPSYLSLESAMSYHGIIPEETPNPTSITTSRTENFHAVERLFIYRHVKPSLFKGYSRVKFGDHDILISTPEKALWDKLYLHVLRNRFSTEWLEGLRLQNLENFNFSLWEDYSKLTPLLNIQQAASEVAEYILEANK